MSKPRTDSYYTSLNGHEYAVYCGGKAARTVDDAIRGAREFALARANKLGRKVRINVYDSNGNEVLPMESVYPSRGGKPRTKRGARPVGTNVLALGYKIARAWDPYRGHDVWEVEAPWGDVVGDAYPSRAAALAAARRHASQQRKRAKGNPFYRGGKQKQRRSWSERIPGPRDRAPLGVSARILKRKQAEAARHAAAFVHTVARRGRRVAEGSGKAAKLIAAAKALKEAWK